MGPATQGVFRFDSPFHSAVMRLIDRHLKESCGIIARPVFVTPPSGEVYRIHRLLDSHQVQGHHVRILCKPRTSLEADYFPGNAGCFRVWCGCLASNHTLQDTCIKAGYEQLVARVVNAVAMGLV